MARNMAKLRKQPKIKTARAHCARHNEQDDPNDGKLLLDSATHPTYVKKAPAKGKNETSTNSRNRQ